MGGDHIWAEQREAQQDIGSDCWASFYSAQPTGLCVKVFYLIIGCQDYEKSKMKLLAIDTVTEACSVALLYKNEIRASYEVTPRGHSQRVLPMVEDRLSQADLQPAQLDALVMDRGPGSFTGVRIGVSVVQGLAFALDLPVISVSSLAALAQAAYLKQGSEQVLAVIDARMGEVYWACCRFLDGNMVLNGEERVGRPDLAIEALDDACWGVGSGWAVYPDLLLQSTGVASQRVLGEQRIHARDVASLGLVALLAGKMVAPEEALPVYIRDNVAEKPARP